MFTKMPKLDPYVTHVLMRDLTGHDRRPASFLVYLWLAAEADQRSADVQISYQELAENVGLSKSAAQDAVRWLIKRRLLAAKKKNATAIPTYKALTPWKNR
jgi:hypothetical protein